MAGDLNLCQDGPDSWQNGHDLWQEGLDLWQIGPDLQQGGLDLWQVGKKIKVALSKVLEPTAAWDLKPRSMLC